MPATLDEQWGAVPATLDAQLDTGSTIFQQQLGNVPATFDQEFDATSCHQQAAITPARFEQQLGVGPTNGDQFGFMPASYDQQVVIAMPANFKEQFGALPTSFEQQLGAVSGSFVPASFDLGGFRATERKRSEGDGCSAPSEEVGWREGVEVGDADTGLEAGSGTGVDGEKAGTVTQTNVVTDEIGARHTSQRRSSSSGEKILFRGWTCMYLYHNSIQD